MLETVAIVMPFFYHPLDQNAPVQRWSAAMTEPRRRRPDGGGHPTGKAIALLVGVTLVLVLLAALSTF